MRKYRAVIILSVLISSLVMFNLPQPQSPLPNENHAIPKQRESVIDHDALDSTQTLTREVIKDQKPRTNNAAKQPVKAPAFNKKLLSIKQYESFNISVPGVGEYIVEVEKVDKDKVLDTTNIRGFVVGEHGLTNKAYVSVSIKGVSGMISTPHGRYGFKSGKTGKLRFTKVEFSHENLH